MEFRNIGDEQKILQAERERLPDMYQTHTKYQES